MPPAGDPGAAGGLAARVAAVTGSPPRRVVSAGGQHRWQHCRVTLATGEQAFAKVAAGNLDGVFESEAAGLRWLAEAGAVPDPYHGTLEDYALSFDLIRAACIGLAAQLSGLLGERPRSPMG